MQPRCDIFVPRIRHVRACARARARGLRVSLRRSAKREKTKVRWPGSLSRRSIAAARAALSSSTSPPPSPFFRSPCCASLRGDVIYSAEFTRVCKQAERKRCTMEEEKERRGERGRVGPGSERVNVSREEPFFRTGFGWALYLPRRFVHLPKGC